MKTQRQASRATKRRHREPGKTRKAATTGGEASTQESSVSGLVFFWPDITSLKAPDLRKFRAGRVIDGNIGRNVAKKRNGSLPTSHFPRNGSLSNKPLSSLPTGHFQNATFNGSLSTGHFQRLTPDGPLSTGHFQRAAFNALLSTGHFRRATFNGSAQIHK